MKEQKNTNIEEVNVETVMKGAEILRNKYEMLYEDIPEADTSIQTKESANDAK